MSIPKRLFKALQRQGIHTEYQRGVYHVRNEAAQASILLPDSLALEAKAVQQLLNFASVAEPEGHRGVCKACATPDFHPGAIAPVGSIVATDADFVIPAAIGTDINCGIRLLHTGLNHKQAEMHKSALIARLTALVLHKNRDVPATAAAFSALFDDGPEACIERLPDAGLWRAADRVRLLSELSECVGLDHMSSSSCWAPEALLNQHDRSMIRPASLADLGGGNHFLEFAVVDRVLDRHAAYAADLKEGDLVTMIHTGSRDVGFYVGQRWIDAVRREWPAGKRHPKHGLYGLVGELADQYMHAMGMAARFAWLNRMALGEMVRQSLTDWGSDDTGRLIVDVPHNVALREHGFNVHRKGATPAHAGQLTLIPGSMGDHSYLATGLGHADWLHSCSHGAGRRVRRQLTRRLNANTGPEGMTGWQCVTLREERRIEEAPAAYKPVGPVITAQEEAGLIRSAVRLRPWLTFKA